MVDRQKLRLMGERVKEPQRAQRAQRMEKKKERNSHESRVLSLWKKLCEELYEKNFSTLTSEVGASHFCQYIRRGEAFRQ
ncbi:MAG: hypothetical protein EAZ78_08490 [Oscillatoriales cyanobacterium]|nr:MAG: hypothetical protein EAZ78_08490 [Oscillatoriales cyanobacterium]